MAIESVFHKVDTLALKFQDCCTNIPATRSTKNGLWNSAISEIKLPSGKYIRDFDKPNCEGKHLDVPHDARAYAVVSSGFNDVIQSFMSISKEMVVTPCQDENGSDGTFQLTVGPTCTVTPDPGLSDVVVSNNNCVCLFDKPNCDGEAFTVSTNYEPGFIIREGFNDRTRSFRACNQHLKYNFINPNR
ncbi:unnamed protein product [Orchesella dallaii]|uniref:Uncharacterized protein n=1 Tax=Orchesella dallaii TaxID=48710 RepID=A0ABP1RQN9_9HEXA